MFSCTFSLNCSTLLIKDLSSAIWRFPEICCLVYIVALIYIYIVSFGLLDSCRISGLRYYGLRL